MLTTDQIMSRAETLARQAGGAGVHDDQLSIVLVHLKRHHDIAATLTLLVELKKSPFAHRNRLTPEQFRALETSVRPALLGVSDWEDAAGIVGWARRLVTFYQPLRPQIRPREGKGYRRP